MFKKNHIVSRTNYRSDGKMSYLHENINDLKITPFASQAEIEYTNRHNVTFCENIYDMIVYM